MLLCRYCVLVFYRGADNEGVDTFAFALVLVCLAASDMLYLRKQLTKAGVRFRAETYVLKWRPELPENVKTSRHKLGRMIMDMPVFFTDLATTAFLLRRLHFFCARKCFMRCGISVLISGISVTQVGPRYERASRNEGRGCDA